MVWTKARGLGGGGGQSILKETAPVNQTNERTYTEERVFQMYALLPSGQTRSTGVRRRRSFRFITREPPVIRRFP